MTHLTDGDLRAHLDNELDAALTEHLMACAECQTRLVYVQATHTAASAHFATLTPAPTDPHLNSTSALQRFNRYRQRKESIPMSEKIKSWLRPALIGAVALSVVIALFTFAPVQQAFSAFLALFRVERVTVISFDPELLPRNFDNRLQTENAERLFSDSVRVTEGGEAKTVADATEASKEAGFTVRLPQGQTPAALTVQPGMQASGQVQLAEIQAVLNAMEIKDIQLPKEFDGATLTLDVASTVSAVYGSCDRSLPADVGEKGPGGKDPNCLALMQLPSPKITSDPPNLNPQPLGEVFLRLLGRSAEEARALSQTIDWTTTLVIPLPLGEAEYRDVNVDGVPGTLIVQADTRTPTYALVWVRDGIVYAIFGFGDTAKAIELGNSLK